MAQAPKSAGLPPDGAALARVIAHELNNIAVPLQGFVELAGTDAITAELLAQCLDEVRIGTTRLLELSRDIAAFAGAVPSLQRVTLRECLPEVFQPIFEVDAESHVQADASCIRDSLSLLSLLANAPQDWLARVDAGPRRTCDACEAKLPARTVLIMLRAVRLPSASMLRDPLDTSHKLRTLQRLRLAAAAHAAHLGGAHLIGSATADWLALAVPTA